MRQELFAQHVVTLRDEDAVVPLDKGLRHGGGLAITFDDGYRDNLTIAAPILSEASIPFTVFVTPGFIESGEAQYLNRSDVKTLADISGAGIGAHGFSHRKLTECDDRELASELNDSRAWIEDLIGRPVTTMSYPHGAVDRRVRNAAEEAGYAIAACSRFGIHGAGDDPFLVPRTDVWANDSAPRLRAKIAGYWDWMAWR